ncbi:unnamed protein product [Vicia faba]|uniref:Uncharacterized protein n=1 Tax=Vicia faba TaxID=3906 RepID=A0AAV1AAS5_VICFA|nr:unnamed protein product [Vicia faba]
MVAVVLGDGRHLERPPSRPNYSSSRRRSSDWKAGERDGIVENKITAKMKRNTTIVVSAQRSVDIAALNDDGGRMRLPPPVESSAANISQEALWSREIYLRMLTSIAQVLSLILLENLMHVKDAQIRRFVPLPLKDPTLVLSSFILRYYIFDQLTVPLSP